MAVNKQYLYDHIQSEINYKTQQVNSKDGFTDGVITGLQFARTIVENSPENEARWLSSDDDSDWYTVHCSNCGHKIDLDQNEGYSDYCPGCGYKMVWRIM